MSPSTAWVWVTRVGVVLLALGALGGLAWGVARWLTRLWSRQASSLSDRLEERICGFGEKLDRLETEAQRYPPDARPPYSPFAQTLHQTLQQARSLLIALSTGKTDMGPEPLQPTGGFWQRGLFTVWYEPRHWWLRRAHCTTQIGKAEQVQALLTKADELLRQLRGQPLEAARWARELYGLAVQALDTAGELRAAGLHGELLDGAQRMLGTHLTALQALPLYLLGGAESQIMRRAEPKEISEAWALLMAHEADIRHQAAQVHTWQEQYGRAGQDLEAMRQAVDLARASLDQANSMLDVTELAQTWERLHEQAQALQLLYASPTVEDLPRLASINQVTQGANRLVGRLAAVEALRTRLIAHLHDHGRRVAELERHLAQLGDAAPYPLETASFHEALAQLKHTANLLGDTTRVRTPQEVEEALARAEVLQQQGRALLARVVEAREARARLIALLDSTAGAIPAELEERVRHLYEKARPYAEDNWEEPDELRVGDLVVDVMALARRYERWVPNQADQRLSPETLTQRVEAVTALFDDIETFERRLDRVTRRLQVLQQAEEAARSELEALYGALDQLDLVADDILPTSLREKRNHWRKVRSLLDEGYALKLALSDPGTGTVMTKADQVHQWVGRCLATLRAWRAALQGEITVALADLRDLVVDVAAVAPLTEESAVSQAEALLEEMVSGPSQEELSTAGSGPVEGGAIEGVQQAGEITRQLRLLTRLDEALAALRDQVVDQLAEPVSRCGEARERAEAALVQLERLQDQAQRLWPPLDCGLDSVRTQLELAQQTRERLRAQGDTVPHALSLLKLLEEQYRQAAALAEARMQSYEETRPSLDAMLERLERWTKALTEYGTRRQEDPAVSAAVRARLDAIAAGLAHLRQQYGVAGPVSGEEARRALEALWRQAYRDLPVGSGQETIAAAEIMEVPS